MTFEKYPGKRKTDTKLSQETVSSAPQIEEHFIEPEMVYIEGGTFQMGSEVTGFIPVHTVTVDSFYMGKYPVTNKEYSQYNPSHEKPGDNLPVVKVSWEDAVAYCQWLREKTGKYYRLPTETEWEYGCRVGTTTEFYWGNEMNSDYCWNWNHLAGKVYPVGQKKSNALGLYDMSGNVWEWCSDWYEEYTSGSLINPTGAKSGSYKVLRGGGWYYSAGNCRSALRLKLIPSIKQNLFGFRIARTP